MVNERLQGLSSDAHLHSIAVFARDIHSRFLQVTEEVRVSNRTLLETQKPLADEREKRITAEQRLIGSNEYRTLREFSQVAGVAFVAIGIDNIREPVRALAFIVAGAVLWFVAFCSGRNRL
jgi:hypothetical protein